MSPQTIRDIQEETMQSLVNEITRLKSDLENSTRTLDELKSILLIVLHLNGGEVKINQVENRVVIKKILTGKLGLSVEEEGGDILKLSLVEVEETGA